MKKDNSDKYNGIENGASIFITPRRNYGINDKMEVKTG